MPSEEDLKAAQTKIAYRQYIVALQAVLSDFQYIEEAIRMYLRDAYKLIRERTKEDLPFKLSEEDVKKDALGTLIAKFDQVCANEDLVKRLRAIVPRRNECAHQGFLVETQPAGGVKELDGRTRDLEELKKATSGCFSSIVEELRPIAAKLGRQKGEPLG